MVSCEAFGSTGWKLLTVSRVGEPVGHRQLHQGMEWENSGGHRQLHQRGSGRAQVGTASSIREQWVLLCGALWERASLKA